MRADISDLNIVKGKFDLWMSNLDTKDKAIPDHLWEEAVMLMDIYPVTRLAIALKVSINQLKKKKESLFTHTEPKKASNNAPKKTTKPKAESPTVTCLKLPREYASFSSSSENLIKIKKGEYELTLPLSLSSDLASTIVSAFMGGLR